MESSSSSENLLNTKHQGFTLVELLVVIAIIGVLVALLLPAVQAAREAARRTQCMNNIRQLAIGVLNFESAKGSLPAGGVTNGNCCSARSGASWTIFVLPYIEQQQLYDLYDFDDFNEDPADSDGDGLQNSVVREYNLQAHNCPSDMETDQLGKPASGPGSNLNYARGSYRGNSGLCTSQSRAFWDSSSQQNQNYDYERGPLPGIGNLSGWSIKKPTKLVEITDGTTNTVMLGEKSHTTISEEGRRRQTFWAYTYTSYNRSLTFLQTRSIISDYDRCLKIGGAFGTNPCKRSWGSIHAGGGFNVAMCDASVQFINDDVDIFLFGAMSTIAGEEVVDF